MSRYKESANYVEGKQNWFRVPRKWTIEQGLSDRESEMLYLWLGISNADGLRLSYSELGTKFGLSKTAVAKTIKISLVKVVMSYREKHGIDSSDESSSG